MIIIQVSTVLENERDSNSQGWREIRRGIYRKSSKKAAKILAMFLLNCCACGGHALPQRLAVFTCALRRSSIAWRHDNQNQKSKSERKVKVDIIITKKRLHGN
jgi:hypothetical protein